LFVSRLSIVPIGVGKKKFLDPARVSSTGGIIEEKKRKLM
jgi:hypothetical protein